MSTYPVDIKSTNLTSTGTIFAGPCRILGVYYDATAGAGTIEILDNATSLCTLNTPDGSTYSHSRVSSISRHRFEMFNQWKSNFNYYK